MHIPTRHVSGKDFSKDEYKIRWWSVVRETTVMVLLHFAANILLLIPLWVTSKKYTKQVRVQKIDKNTHKTSISVEN